VTSEHLFVLLVVILGLTVGASIYISKNRPRLKQMILQQLNIGRVARPSKPHVPEQSVGESESRDLIPEEDSKAELERLKKLIDDRKQIARDTDISHHLWGLYKSHFRFNSTQSFDRYIQDGKWYSVKTLRSSSQNGLNKFEFELKRVKYKFVDDEERQVWHDNLKLFSLFLYDHSGHCLIEIPMKLRVDKTGRHYSISSDGPKAFLPDEWIKDFINVKLKHQRLRNQEIRAQKHQERLSEIEELKDRFGIWD